jgi:hypothetical protein
MILPPETQSSRRTRKIRTVQRLSFPIRKLRVLRASVVKSTLRTLPLAFATLLLATLRHRL